MSLSWRDGVEGDNVLSVVKLAVTDAKLIILMKNARFAKCNSEHHTAKQVFVATHKQSTNVLHIVRAQLIFTSAGLEHLRRG